MSASLEVLVLKTGLRMPTRSWRWQFNPWSLPHVEVIEHRLPVIQVNGRHLLTVTEQDAPTGRTAPEQAQFWVQRVEGAIQRGQQSL